MRAAFNHVPTCRSARPTRQYRDSRLVCQGILHTRRRTTECTETTEKTPLHCGTSSWDVVILRRFSFECGISDCGSAALYYSPILRRRGGIPAVSAAGISDNVGWRALRHTLGTLMKAKGEDIKTIQELLRHANHRVTADVYTQAMTAAKRKHRPRSSQ